MAAAAAAVTLILAAGLSAQQEEFGEEEIKDLQTKNDLEEA